MNKSLAKFFMVLGIVFLVATFPVGLILISLLFAAELYFLGILLCLIPITGIILLFIGIIITSGPLSNLEIIKKLGFLSYLNEEKTKEFGNIFINHQTDTFQPKELPFDVWQLYNECLKSDEISDGPKKKILFSYQEFKPFFMVTSSSKDLFSNNEYSKIVSENIFSYDYSYSNGNHRYRIRFVVMTDYVFGFCILSKENMRRDLKGLVHLNLRFLGAFDPNLISNITYEEIVESKTIDVYEPVREVDINDYLPVFDSQIISRHWKYENVNGTRSFRGGLKPEKNPLIVNLKYGSFSASIGEFPYRVVVSNAQKAKNFADTMNALRGRTII